MPHYSLALDYSSLEREMLNKRPLGLFLIMDNIRFIGRHTIKDGLEYFSYSGCGFEFDVEPKDNKSINININLISELRDYDEQYVSIFINDIFYKKEKLNSGEFTINLKTNKKEKTRFRIVKCNETYLSSIYLKSIEIDGGIISKPSPKRRLIEFYGDSLTCGYGLLVQSIDEFYMKDEDFTKTYAYLASFALNMDYSVVARSGISLALKIYCDKLFDEIYDTVDMINKCDTNYKVDYAVINLGANDCNAYNADSKIERPFEKVYQEYIKLVDKIVIRNKDVKFVLCYGMVDLYPQEMIEKFYDVKDYIERTYHNKVSVLKFVPNNEGAASHPFHTAHKENAKLLVEAIKNLK